MTPESSNEWISGSGTSVESQRSVGLEASQSRTAALSYAGWPNSVVSMNGRPVEIMGQSFRDDLTLGGQSWQ